MIRPRRQRAGKLIRQMARETRVSASSLILPIFIKEGNNILEEISAMPGQYRYSVDNLNKIADSALNSGVSKLLLFGLPNEKDSVGSTAYAHDGIVQKGIEKLKKDYKNELFIITDVCLCEYTSHGHCGLLKGEIIDNDSTLPLLAKTALSHAMAGADMVAPSDMMDKRVGAIRNELDKFGFIDTAIMSYGVKYCSAFYGPFRDAAQSAPSFGDRSTYQMDYHNAKEAVKEALLDVEEGADIMMVKPALSYLDVIKEVSNNVNIPVAAYSVSGEYSMIKAAAAAGYIDEYKVMCETAISIYRAGANILATYYANEIAGAINKGDIG